MSIFPLSIIEISVIAIIPISILYIVIGIIRIVKSKKKKSVVFKFVINPLCFLSIIFFLFTANYGVSYYRYTFADTYGFIVRASTAEELENLCIYLAENANITRLQTKSGENGEMILSSNIDDTLQEAKASYNNMSDKYFTLYSGYNTCKKVIFSEVMSNTNTMGIFSPFTFEANLNVNIPDLAKPITICHELSHLRGYAREDEANFIAYLVCKNSNNPDFQYSAYVYSLRFALNRLYKADKEKYDYVYMLISDEVKNDLVQYNIYWSKYQTKISEISHTMNDVYLKVNSQKDGSQSYGRMVDLLLAEYRMNTAD